MSYYSVADNHCAKYRDAIKKINQAKEYLNTAHNELSKNKSESIDSLKKEIVALIDYENDRIKEISNVISSTLIEAKSRDEAARRRAEAQAKHHNENYT